MILSTKVTKVTKVTKLNNLQIYNKTTNKFQEIYLQEDGNNLNLVVELEDGLTKKMTFN